MLVLYFPAYLALATSFGVRPVNVESALRQRTAFASIEQLQMLNESASTAATAPADDGAARQSFRQPSLAPQFPLVAARLQQRRRFNTRTRQAISTILRVALPTVLATLIGFAYFDNLSLLIRSTLDIGTIRILQADDAQFIQNFLTVIGLLFSILAGNAYSALYQQQVASAAEPRVASALRTLPFAARAHVAFRAGIDLFCALPRGVRGEKPPGTDNTCVPGAALLPIRARLHPRLRQE